MIMVFRHFQKLLLFIVVLLFSLYLGEQPLCAPYVIDPQDYHVYSSLLDAWFGDEQTRITVVRGRTALGIELESFEQELTYAQEVLAGLLPETISDFKAKNVHSYPVGDFITQRAAYKLISQNEIVDLFRYQDGWGRFYQRYPEADGIITFSRVGYSSRGNQALVYVGSQWNDFSGAGIYIVLNKGDQGIWNIGENLRLWHSWLPEDTPVATDTTLSGYKPVF